MFFLHLYRLRSLCGAFVFAILVSLAARAFVWAKRFWIKFIAKQRNETADTVASARMPIDGIVVAANSGAAARN